MSIPPRSMKRIPCLAMILSLALPLSMVSCASDNPKTLDTPSPYTGRMPSVAGSSQRPVHTLSREEYPFDSQGNYIVAWAKAGDRKYGKLPARYTSKKSRRKSSRASKRSSTKKKKAPARVYHTVRKGDTLWRLSKRYGTSIAKIKRTNGLRSDAIRLGQRLRIR